MDTKQRTHTPEPWRIGDAQNTIFGPPNGKTSPQTIAHLGVIDHEANGRLIAAAPELLAALKELGEARPYSVRWDNAMLHAGRAMAQAEGR